MGLKTILSGVRIIVLGEANVGKTCFTDMFLKGDNFVYYDPLDEYRRLLYVNGKEHAIRPMDLSSTTLRDPDPDFSASIFQLCFAKTKGIVLIYDITNRASFDLLTRNVYLDAVSARQSMSTKNENWGKRCAFVLVGNKADVIWDEPEKREVDVEVAEEWAQSQGFGFVEVSSKKRAEVDAAISMLVRSMEVARRADERDKLARKSLDKGRDKKTPSSFRTRIKSAFGRAI